MESAWIGRVFRKLKPSLPGFKWFLKVETRDPFSLALIIHRHVRTFVFRSFNVCMFARSCKCWIMQALDHASVESCKRWIVQACDRTLARSHERSHASLQARLHACPFLSDGSNDKDSQFLRLHVIAHTAPESSPTRKKPSHHPSTPLVGPIARVTVVRTVNFHG